MLKRIIPCLDVNNGRVVKGINCINLVDAGDPTEQAKFYSENGADEICFLDITASNENRNTILDIVKKTSQQCFVPLTVGGGVRNINDISNNSPFNPLNYSYNRNKVVLERCRDKINVYLKNRENVSNITKDLNTIQLNFNY